MRLKYDMIVYENEALSTRKNILSAGTSIKIECIHKHAIEVEGYSTYSSTSSNGYVSFEQFDYNVIKEKDDNNYDYGE